MALKKSLKRAGKQSAKKTRPDPNHLLPGKTPVMQGGMPKALGIRITSLSPRKVTAEMPVTPAPTIATSTCSGNGARARPGSVCHGDVPQSMSVTPRSSAADIRTAIR